MLKFKINQNQIKTKIIVLAQGNCRRWKTFLGVPKHLVNINNETIVERACRLFSTKKTDLLLICPNDKRYPIDKYNHHELKCNNPTNTEQDRFFVSSPFWSKIGPTIIVWGDVFFTENAVKIILNKNFNDIHYFRRPYKSKITGHQWDESFAVGIPLEKQEKFLKISQEIVELIKQKKLRKDHVRTHYAKFLNLKNIDSVRNLLNTPHQTIIDDFTDDFDTPREYIEWIKRYYKI